MDGKMWAQLRPIVEDALDLPAAERERFLADQLGEESREFSEALVLASFSDDDLDAVGACVEASMDPYLLLPDPRVGAYLLIHKVGEGGSGVVYKAVRDDGTTARKVAVKILHWNLLESAASRNRLLAEIKTLSRLNHPYIAHLYNWSDPSECSTWFAMELVDGTPVTDFCARSDLLLRDRLKLFQKICQAVAHAHEHLVLHLDLAPGNILVISDGNPKLLDFGIARAIEEGGATRSRGSGYSQLTMLYASPEQFYGGDLSTRSDVFSLGVILYEMLTGQNPLESRIQAGTPESQSYDDQPVPSISAKDLATSEEWGWKDRFRNRRQRWAMSKDLDKVLSKGLAQNPKNRY